MNKLFSRIAIAIASFAMVIGGVSIVSKQAEATHADTGDVVATFDCEDCIGYTHTEWVDFHGRGWKISFGGDYRCGFDAGEWKTIEEQGYSKYINGTDISPDAYGWIAVRIETLSFVGGFDFRGYYPPNSNLYLTYSLDDTTYSLVPLTEGEQGTKLDSNHQSLSYGFNSIREAYYAIVVVSTKANPASNDLFEFSEVICNFYEKIDPTAERITISGSNTTYADEEIELTAATYNYSPSEYTWTSSDTSIVTVSSDGNRATIHGVNKGTACITVSTNGTNGIVYTDPFAITVKKFDFNELNTTITMNVRELKSISLSYQDNLGKVVLEATSANANIATVTTRNEKQVIITAGNICGISTTVTITAKDNDGNEGCHIVTRTVQVTVGARRTLGERLTSRPSNEQEYVYIATIDGKHFVTTTANSLNLSVTDNIKEATVFVFNYSGNISVINSFGNLSYFYFNRSCMVLNSRSLDFSIKTNVDGYPGVLTYHSSSADYFMYFANETTIENSLLSRINNDTFSPSNVFCAYYAVDPGANITPEETSIELIDGEPTDIDAEVAFVNDTTYEIIKGASFIEEVTVSDVDDLNHINIHIEASSNATGTAVIRIKDANDDSVYTDITVVVKNTTKLSVGTISTQAKLSYEYARDGEEYDISNVAIRFGGMINKDTWDILDNKFGIEAFGVMLSNSNSIEQRVDEKIADEGSFDNAVETGGKFDTVKDNDIKVFYDYLFSGSEPAEQGNYYFWNLYKMVNATEIGFKRQYTAVAFILTSDGDVVFFDEVTTSATKLADELAADDSIVEATEGSICYIANYNEDN